MTYPFFTTNCYVVIKYFQLYLPFIWGKSKQINKTTKHHKPSKLSFLSKRNFPL